MVDEGHDEVTSQLDRADVQGYANEQRWSALANQAPDAFSAVIEARDRADADPHTGLPARPEDLYHGQKM